MSIFDAVLMDRPLLLQSLIESNVIQYQKENIGRYDKPGFTVLNIHRMLSISFHHRLFASTSCFPFLYRDGPRFFEFYNLISVQGNKLLRMIWHIQCTMILIPLLPNFGAAITKSAAGLTSTSSVSKRDILGPLGRNNIPRAKLSSA